MEWVLNAELMEQQPPQGGFFTSEENQEQGQDSEQRLSVTDLIQHHNIAELLDEQTLTRIGAKVADEYEIDRESRADWEQQIDEAMKVAKQIKEEKSFPWPKAANVKYPMIAIAAMQFAARAYPEIVQGDKVVGCEVIGQDQDGSKTARAQRVSDFMSYQLLDQMESWDEDTDRLLHVLPVTGLIWRKTYYDPAEGHNCSEMILPKDVVVHYYTKSLDKAPRITHVFELAPNEIEERQRGGSWLDIDLGQPEVMDGHDGSDEEAPHKFFEQHRFWDLDDDGYREPYIVTVHEQTRKVVRIVARFDESGILMTQDGRIGKIKPIQYFKKYSFIPSPDGSFYDIGFGVLLNPLNETINTLLNQMLDAGTLANMGGGFIGKGARMQGGAIRFKPGEWKPVYVQGMVLRDAIVPLPTREPSAVLFNLLSLLLEAAKQLSTVPDEMTGQKTSPNEPATSMLTRIEQGMKVFSAIHKRIYRSLTKEFQALYELNRKYLSQEQYANVLDDPAADVRADFEDQSINVLPVADPNISSDMQRLARAQAILQAGANIPGVDMHEAGKRYFEALRVENLDALMPPPDPNQPPQPPPPEVMLAQAKIQDMQRRLELDGAKAHEDDENAKQKIANDAAVRQQQAQLDADLKLKQYVLELDARERMHALELGQKDAAHMREMELRKQELESAREDKGEEE